MILETFFTFDQKDEKTRLGQPKYKGRQRKIPQQRQRQRELQRQRQQNLIMMTSATTSSLS